MDHTARVAVVTGANKGIGKHIARQLAENGVTVFVGSRDEGRGRATVAELRGEGLPVAHLKLDVTDAGSIAAAVRTVRVDSGHLDVLVNNAGIASGLAPTTEVELDALRATFETNVFGVVAVTNAFLPLLRASRSARIVNVSSSMGSVSAILASADLAARNNAAYQASKAALNLLTILYANELRADRILVNAVSPGYRATDLSAGHPTPGAGDPAGGARSAVLAALLPDDGPTATYFSDTGSPRPW